MQGSNVQSIIATTAIDILKLIQMVTYGCGNKDIQAHQYASDTSY